MISRNFSRSILTVAALLAATLSSAEIAKAQVNVSITDPSSMEYWTSGNTQSVQGTYTVTPGTPGPAQMKLTIYMKDNPTQEYFSLTDTSPGSPFAFNFGVPHTGKQGQVVCTVKVEAFDANLNSVGYDTQDVYITDPNSVSSPTMLAMSRSPGVGSGGGIQVAMEQSTGVVRRDPFDERSFARGGPRGPAVPAGCRNLLLRRYA